MAITNKTWVNNYDGNGNVVEVRVNRIDFALEIKNNRHLLDANYRNFESNHFGNLDT